MLSPPGFEMFTTTIYFHVEKEGPERLCRLISMKVRVTGRFFVLASADDVDSVSRQVRRPHDQEASKWDQQERFTMI